MNDGDTGTICNDPTMKHRFIMLFMLSSFISAFSFGQDSITQKTEDINRYVLSVNANISKYQKEHSKCCDCFGTDTYFKDSATIVKIHNYQSCFKIDYYYRDNDLVMVTIDGSFKRGCGRSEANYCWDTSIIRNYKAEIYYDRQNILKQMESGVKPCCKIAPCGDYDNAIDFDNKAKLFLNNILKPKHKIQLDSIMEYLITDRSGNEIILHGNDKKINVSKLKFNTLYVLRKRNAHQVNYIIRQK